MSNAPPVASFRVDVTAGDAIAFAKLSGDWNPLHTNPEHAAQTAYRRPVLHGAFSAGLVSRMAGMHLPGADCLLHGMRLRFVRPIIPPASLHIEGRQVSDSGQLGHVDVTISDVDTGVRYVEAGYDFSRHEVETITAGASPSAANTEAATVLVTGATGGLGRAVLAKLGAGAIGTSRAADAGLLHVADLERIGNVIGERPLSAIVHCASPSPDNEPLTALPNIENAVEHNVAAPLRQVIALAQLLRRHGTRDAVLVLVGSAWAAPGRHMYRRPLYSISKALVPTLVKVLALELAGTGHRAVGVSFDVIDGGMNKQLSPSIRAMHADRTPTGQLPTSADAAEQIGWVLQNRSFLASGATIDLSGAAIP